MAKAGDKFTSRLNFSRPRLMRIGGSEVWFGLDWRNRYMYPPLDEQLRGSRSRPEDQPRPVKQRRKKREQKLLEVLSVLLKLYPPDGKVPGSDPIKTVLRKVIDELGYDVSASTVNRALVRTGREK